MTEEIRIPGPLAEACRKLYDIRMAMAADADVRRARRRVMDQTHLLQDANNELERRELEYQNEIKEVETYITAHALEVGESFESGGISVKYRKGYESVTYSKKEIELLIKADPFLEEKIKLARKVKPVDPKVTIS